MLFYSSESTPSRPFPSVFLFRNPWTVFALKCFSDTWNVLERDQEMLYFISISHVHLQTFFPKTFFFLFFFLFFFIVFSLTQIVSSANQIMIFFSCYPVVGDPCDDSKKIISYLKKKNSVTVLSLFTIIEILFIFLWLRWCSDNFFVIYSRMILLHYVALVPTCLREMSLKWRLFVWYEIRALVSLIICRFFLPVND